MDEDPKDPPKLRKLWEDHGKVETTPRRYLKFKLEELGGPKSVAREFGVSQGTVYRWTRHYGFRFALTVLE